MKIFLSLVVMALWTGSQDVRAQNVFTIDESAIECIQVIGPAPELREMSRRVAKKDPGRMVGFVVKLSEKANRHALDAFGDVIRLDLSAAGDEFHDAPGATTPTLPRDRFLLFTMSETVADYISGQRSRCGSRTRFDKAPFEQLLRGNRETLRGMLDQERR